MCSLSRLPQTLSLPLYNDTDVALLVGGRFPDHHHTQLVQKKREKVGEKKEKREWNESGEERREEGGGGKKTKTTNKEVKDTAKGIRFFIIFFHVHLCKQTLYNKRKREIKREEWSRWEEERSTAGHMDDTAATFPTAFSHVTTQKREIKKEREREREGKCLGTVWCTAKTVGERESRGQHNSHQQRKQKQATVKQTQQSPFPTKYRKKRRLEKKQT